MKYTFILPFCCMIILSCGTANQIAFASDDSQMQEETDLATTPDSLVADWLLQDFAFDEKLGQVVGRGTEICFQSEETNEIERSLVEKVLRQIGNKATDEQKQRFKELQSVPGNDGRWKELYVSVCQVRRKVRLESVLKATPKILFTKHHNLDGSHYAYNEGLSDAQAEHHFSPGTQLCLLEANDFGDYSQRVLIDDPKGVIRDPDISVDGKFAVFAWKKSDREDDFHLYKMDLNTYQVTQLTFGLGYADYEPCCLPDGRIVFNSTRCIQVVDCSYSEVSNLYSINADGTNIRRVCFDQVHDNYPTLTQDGRVIYTRWDYNDRGQLFPQGLFQMNPDGTGQTAVYGNNSWFPTSILHARNVPGTGKYLCIFSGHHTRQRGKLGLVDPQQGSEEDAGTSFVAPIRPAMAVRVDQYGQQGEQFCYPYPLSQNSCLVAWRPALESDVGAQASRLQENIANSDREKFSLYWMSFDGQRELLATDERLSCNQSIPVQPKKVRSRPTVTDPKVDYGVYYIQNIFLGPGLEGVDKNAVRSLRVVALEFRTAGIGRNGNVGPAGGAMVSTPISTGWGSWDVKRVLGEASIYSDGSACFRVPAKTPVYFQVIDKAGYVIQTMRSWSTLQPGERFSCLGCHEEKNQGTQTSVGLTEAMKRGVEQLKPFYGPARGFSFQKEIQPILDRHCVRCHNNPDSTPPYMENPSQRIHQTPEQLGLKRLDNPDSNWSYTTSKPNDNWTKQFPLPQGQETKMGVGNIPYLEVHRHVWDKVEEHDIWLTSELEMPSDYKPHPLFAQLIHDEDVEMYINGIRVFSASGFTQEYFCTQLLGNPLKPGKNVIALHCYNEGGGQGLDVSIWEQPSGKLVTQSDKPFSLKDERVLDPIAKRFWTKSYLHLTKSAYRHEEFYNGHQNRLVNWINVQSEPTLLKPYTAGSAKSELLRMFSGPKPHNDVQLSTEEKEKLACWIDLLIPFCGDYQEASHWTEEDKQLWNNRVEKKRN